MIRHTAALVEMQVRTLELLKELKVRVIVIDEVHNLLAGSPREQRVILRLFRHSEPILKEVESTESVVIPLALHDSPGSARCGSLNIVSPRTVAAFVIPLISPMRNGR